MILPMTWTEKTCVKKSTCHFFNANRIYSDDVNQMCRKTIVIDVYFYCRPIVIRLQRTDYARQIVRSRLKYYYCRGNIPLPVTSLRQTLSPMPNKTDSRRFVNIDATHNIIIIRAMVAAAVVSCGTSAFEFEGCALYGCLPRLRVDARENTQKKDASVE